MSAIVQMSPAAPPSSPLGFVILIALAIIAISGAPRKLRALLVIFAWMTAGFAVGTAFGFLLFNPAVAGDFANILVLTMGIGASVARMRENKKIAVIPAKVAESEAGGSCQQCGQAVNAASSFCPSCGRSVGSH
jgi:hypothetical protein